MLDSLNMDSDYLIETVLRHVHYFIAEYINLIVMLCMLGNDSGKERS